MAKKILNQIYDDKKKGFFTKYKEISVGSSSLLFFIYFEVVTTLFSNIPGALGLFLRAVLYRPLFRKIGNGVVFGAHIVIRNPKKIEIGNRVIVDDNCVLDAKGDECEGIFIGDNVFLSRNVIFGCKNGCIRLGSDITIGPNTTVHSVDECKISIGSTSVIAAYSYIIGGADYKSDKLDVPMSKQGFYEGKGIIIEEDVWLGAGVFVLDGAHIEKGSIIGAKALVKGNIPPYAVALGTPAKVKKYRKGKNKNE